MSNVTPDSIFQVASGFMASKHLYVANELGLFEQLGETVAAWGTNGNASKENHAI